MSFENFDSDVGNTLKWSKKVAFKVAAESADCAIDYFKILGLSEDSSITDVSQVRGFHYALAHKFHPDKNLYLDKISYKASNNIMAAINGAVDVAKGWVIFKNKTCNSARADELLREVSSKYGSFVDYIKAFNEGRVLDSAVDQVVKSEVSLRVTRIRSEKPFDCKVDYFV